MASNVCPVCKTFRSSSNTTLNAHIDQCLSREPAIKCPPNPKVIKVRVTKRRKMRSMVEICKTAPSCTLEELDRRNGSNWAIDSSPPTQETESHGEEQVEEEREWGDNVVDDSGHEGDVHMDSDEGTEPQILSAPEIGVEDDRVSPKLLKRKGDEFVGGKNEKKAREEKHHKPLELPPRSEKCSSPSPLRDFEMESDEEESVSVEEDWQEEEYTPDQSSESEEEELLELDDEDTLISSPERSESMDISSDESDQDDEYFDHLPLRVSFQWGSSASKKGVELRGPSLRKRLLPVSRKSVPESRSGWKRIFSDLEETRTHVGPAVQEDHLDKQLQDSCECGEQALSSVQPTNAVVDSLTDEESSGKEIESHEEGPTIEPNTTTSAVETNCLNPEPDPQNSIDQGLCSEAEKMTGQTNGEIAESDDEEMAQGFDSQLEVEPINIPGPPGSFLPSPRADMVTEDVQRDYSSLTNSGVPSSEGNPSLTNNRVNDQSSDEGHLDLADKDSMLDTPICTSTNPTLTRPESVVSVVAVEENPVQQPATIEGERTEATIPENGVAPSLRNDNQLSTFSRNKGNVALSFVSLYKESVLLKRRAMLWNTRLVNNSLTSNSETLAALPNNPPEEEEEAVVPLENENNSHAPTTAPPTDSAAAASPSYLVLRLMGKDLIVINNKDQHVSAPPQPPPQSTVSREMMNASPATLNGVPEGSSSSLVGVSREVMMNTSAAGTCNRVPESSMVGVLAPVSAHQRSATT